MWNGKKTIIEPGSFKIGRKKVVFPSPMIKSFLDEVSALICEEIIKELGEKYDQLRYKHPDLKL